MPYLRTTPFPAIRGVRFNPVFYPLRMEPRGIVTRRVYKFMLKTQKEVSFIGTRYYPVDIDPCLSPYTTVLATIWDEDHMVGQVNQTEILAWWSEVYQEPAPEAAGQVAPMAVAISVPISSTKSDGVLLPKNT